MEKLTGPGDTYDLKRLSKLRKKSGKLLLFIDAEVPRYDIAAGYFIVFEYLKILLRNDYNIIYWPYDRRRIEPYTGEMQKLGIEVVYGDMPFSGFVEQYGRYIDITIVSRPEIIADYLGSIIKFTNGKIIYLAHDLHYLRMSRNAEVLRDEQMRTAALVTKEEELGNMARVDAALFFNKEEVSLVKKEGLGINAVFIPWVQEINVDESELAGFGARRDMVYMGGFQHKPNEDAVIWLHDEVFPMLKKQVPDAKILIVGSNIPERIKQLDSEEFKILGYVEDLRSCFERIRVFISPLRFGAGIKGKITMAQSYGLPVVTTSVGAEGMGLEDGVTAMIADSAEGFAEKAAHIYHDKELWERVSHNAIQHIRVNYSPQTAEREIIGIIENIPGKSRGSGLAKKLIGRLRSSLRA